MRKKLTTKQFIEKANKIHGNKYDYSKVEYINSIAKVCIICSKHGEFYQTPHGHLQEHGCSICSNKQQPTIQQFIEKANKIHSNKYNYSKVIYINNYNKVCITCPQHEEFWQTPHNHLRGRGCSVCAKTHQLTTQTFTKRANRTHNNKYDYSKVEYKNAYTKVKIICPEHGSFWQRPHNHLKGSGCPICNQSRGEEKIRRFLEINKVKFEQQKTFPKCKNINVLSFDFYLLKHNMLIEYDGIQHYKKIDFWGGGKHLTEAQKHDKIKNNFAKDNNIKLLRIPYWEKDSIKIILEKAL